MRVAVGERRSPLTHQLLGALMWMVMGSGAQTVLSVGILAVLARLLTPRDYGLLAAGLIVGKLGQHLSLLSMGRAIVQRRELSPTHIRTGFTVNLVLGICMAGLVWFLAPAIAEFMRQRELVPLVRALAFGLPLSSSAVVAEALLQRRMEFRPLAGVTLASYLVGWGVVGIPAAAAGWGVWALVIAYLAEVGTRSTALLVIQRHPKSPTLDRGALRDLLGFAAWGAGGSLMTFLARQGDYIVVGRWLGPAALGLYSRAYGLMGAGFTLLGGAVADVLLPVFSRLQNERQRLAASCRRGISTAAMLLLPVCVLAYVQAPELVAVLLGPRWVEVVMPFRILTIGVFLRTAERILAAATWAVGAVAQTVWRQGVHAAAVLAGAWIGQRFGISGVAAGVAGAMVVNYLINAALALRNTSLSWREFVGAHIAGAWLAATAFGVGSWLAGVQRSAAVPAPVNLIVTFAATTAILILLVRRVPAMLLGYDGPWLIRTIGASLPTLLRLRPVPVSMPSALGVAEGLRGTAGRAVDGAGATIVRRGEVGDTGDP